MNKIQTSINAWYLKQLAAVAILFKRDALALSLWRRIHAMVPNHAANAATLGHLEASQGNAATARSLLTASLALNPAQSSVWFNLGFLQQEADEHPLAIESFDKSIAINAKQDRAHYGKAISLIKLGQLDEAIVCLKLNTKLQPLSPFAWYQLAHIYARLNDHDRVAKTIRKLARFEPKVAMQLERETGVNVGVALPFQ